VDRRVLICAVIAAALAGCEKRSALYCQMNHEDPRCTEDACESDVNCPGRRCDMTAGVCVDCLSSLDCRDELNPVCNLDALTCDPCAGDDQCTAGVCLGSGKCVAESGVLFVSAGAASGNDCSSATPCTLDEGIAKVDPTHAVVRLLAGTYSQTVALPDKGMPYTLSGEWTSGAPVAVIRGVGNDAVQVEGGANVMLDDLEIRESSQSGVNVANAASLSAVHLLLRKNAQAGLTADGANKISLAESYVMENSLGGVYIVDTVNIDIENNFIVGNGSGSQNAQGMHLERSPGVARFNTIVGNHQGNSSSDPPGLDCDGAIEADSNLITDNTRGMSPSNYPMQVHTQAGCDLGTAPKASYTTPGMGDESLLFTNIALDWGGYHLRPDAPAAVLNVPGFSCTGRDADRETRPMGAACDLGADELAQ
jgi:hypothetical protein